MPSCGWTGRGCSRIPSGTGHIPAIRPGGKLTPTAGANSRMARTRRHALLLPILALAALAPSPGPACAAAPLAQERPEPPRRSCAGGQETVAFGRLLIHYGMQTLQYGIGIVLVFLGLVVTALGYMLLAIELLLCWS